MEVPINIGNRSPKAVATEYAKTWKDGGLMSNQIKVLASEIAEIIELFLAREREKGAKQ